MGEGKSMNLNDYWVGYFAGSGMAFGSIAMAVILKHLFG